jgi:signal transduction histidine kinase
MKTISKKSLEVLSRAKATSDYCHDSKSPSYLVGNDQYFQIIKQLKAKGIRQRFITEITEENVRYSKELANHVELRHLEGVKGNFGIVDGKEYGAAANIYDPQSPAEFIYSNVKSFVDQQQYFFETLWNKAIPAEKKIREIEEGIPIEKTEVIEGTEEVINKLIEGFSKIRETFDNCIDSSCPLAYVSTSTVWDRCIELNQRGVKLRFITEITRENISYCKEMMKISEVRHLDKVKGNFGIADKKDYRGVADMEEGKPPTQAIKSTVKSFVDQQQYFFETLWNKAIPAEKKIREIEEGIPPEVTEIWYGSENIIKKSWETLSRAKVSSDYCHNSKSPSILVTIPHYLLAMKELTERGVRHRFVTEITKENMEHCKELAKYVELRHLDEVKGNFSIIDGKEYGATANLQEFQPPSEFIYSNAKEFVDQQQYFFETLWNKAIPAEQRIKEIEEGRPPEKLEIIQDTQKSIGRAFDIMNKTQKELLVLFPTPRTLTLALQAGAADVYRKMSENGVNIQVLIPIGGTNKIEENNDKQMIAKLREEVSPSINLRLSDIDLNTRITIMVSDRNEFMSWELKDDTLDDPYLAGGIATYSNIRSLASSYATIFDNLWKLTELAENLRIANIKLESNEKAMKEFINIAAHELRTPIQPILGLSEMLYYPSSTTTDDLQQQQQKKLIDVIVRNAHKLENLAEDILDVTRIESGRLQLLMEKIDLQGLVESVVSDFQRFLPADGKVAMNYQKLSSDDCNDDHGLSHLAIMGDRERIAQVLSNLLRNALKFTKEGPINVRVRRNDRTSSSYSEAVVSISDSGQGIDPEIMNKLFEKFVSKSEKGTGLGLFISKSIVEALGGKIWAQNNKDGKGATFTFTLPLAT